MPEQELSALPTRNSFAFFALFLIIFISYFNSFSASWHLDDYANIAGNPNIQIDEVNPESMEKAMHFGGRISRPVVRLSFALNWYFGNGSVFEFHLTNLVIHILSAWMLFLTGSLLFQTPNLKHTDATNAYGVCLLGTLLWAVNPIQTQAVTYIVQRMASMAALFYISGLYCYFRARLTETRCSRVLYYFLVILFFSLGMGTKENVAILPMAILFAEFIFFRDTGRNKNWYTFGLIIFFSAIVVAGTGLVIFGGGNPVELLKASPNRFFTPIERLMTGPRILVCYISQIFYPIPGRLSVEHDFPLSTSLFSPWTTIPAILLILGLIGAGFSLIRRHPLHAFSILFFFLNHLVESTVLDLELFFEHRNYLPSMFLFFPVAAILLHLLEPTGIGKRIRTVIIAFIPLIIISFGLGTYNRNAVWKNEKTLLEDSWAKAPNSGRILHSLAWAHYEKIGRPDIAMALYQKALGLQLHLKTHKALIYNNIAALFFANGNNEAAIKNWETAIEIFPDYDPASFRLAIAYAQIGNYGQAIKLLDRLLKKNPKNANGLNLRGIIHIKKKEYQKAIPFFRAALIHEPDHMDARVNLAMAMAGIGQYDKAVFFLKDAHKRSPKEIFPILCLIDISLKTGEKRNVDFWVDTLAGIATIRELERIMTNSGEDVFSIPISRERIRTVLMEKLEMVFHIRKTSNSSEARTD